ncbi:putative aquarius [Cyclospora cayetanensis]|uniref:Aquarius n=1 Tax=Cyclospora cayetanensis TaxID=88456 RepID=A0A1D3CYB0_9EIME|nr:putative aquarius [Cyclospora cayetanensis]
MNVLLRRSARQNNFKAVLATIKSLMNNPEDVVVPPWVHDLFLGYGDPKGCTYTRMASRLPSLDLRDTFLDVAHMKEAFPLAESLELPHEETAAASQRSQQQGYHRLHFTRPKQQEAEKAAEGFDALGEVDALDATRERIRFESYTLPSYGPYPECERKRNRIRFTPTQVRALISGLQPGLTVVLGPPGSGKTDTAAQLAYLLYHANPNEKTLLVAHSNAALNDLFRKVAALDVDETRLLRLGRGSLDLQQQQEVWQQQQQQQQREDLLLPLEGCDDVEDFSFSKHGRVNKVLERRKQLLQRVGRLGDSSCEAALQFFKYHIQFRTERYFAALNTIRNLKQQQQQLPEGEEDEEFRRKVEAAIERYEQERGSRIFVMLPTAHFKYSRSLEELLFPFTAFFADAPQPLFPGGAEADAAVASSCIRYLEQMQHELQDYRAFELLRTAGDRADFLLTTHARMVAMTCTHAAITRDRLVDLGFTFDSLLVEEAAQILEVETFIPMLLQKAREKTSRLKRIILIGDNHQLPPIVKHMTLQQFSHLDQSLYERFVRLGVPCIMLDRQGRARPSLGSLYSWRYARLENLPLVEQAPLFAAPNPGLGCVAQFVDVSDYKGRGESCPLPHFYQNLGEAEYIVAVYMHMRLLGYPRERIAILTTYNGQLALLQDVLQQKCAWNPAIGMPRAVATVDKYQGLQSDYVLLSLVRTNRVGHLRDIRRLIVAVSRARLDDDRPPVSHQNPLPPRRKDQAFLAFHAAQRLVCFGVLSWLPALRTARLQRERKTAFGPPSRGPLTYIRGVEEMQQLVQQHAARRVAALKEQLLQQQQQQQQQQQLELAVEAEAARLAALEPEEPRGPLPSLRGQFGSQVPPPQPLPEELASLPLPVDATEVAATAAEAAVAQGGGPSSCSRATSASAEGEAVEERHALAAAPSAPGGVAQSPLVVSAETELAGDGDSDVAAGAAEASSSCHLEAARGGAAERSR